MRLGPDSSNVTIFNSLTWTISQLLTVSWVYPSGSWRMGPLWNITFVPHTPGICHTQGRYATKTCGWAEESSPTTQASTQGTSCSQGTITTHQPVHQPPPTPVLKSRVTSRGKEFHTLGLQVCFYFPCLCLIKFMLSTEEAFRNSVEVMKQEKKRHLELEDNVIYFYLFFKFTKEATIEFLTKFPSACKRRIS